MPNREQFEAWAKARFLDTTQSKDAWGQPVYSPHIESMWIGWQAGAAAATERAAKICEDLAAPEGMHGTAVSIWDVATLDCAEAIIRDRSAP